MKHLLAAFLLLCTLTGCGRQAPMDGPMELRMKLLAGKGCRFIADVTADYGQDIYVFSLDCQGNPEGDLSFTVISPQTVQGISGVIQDEKGALTFQDQMLAFPPLVDGQITPIISPWLIFRGLRSGFISGSGKDRDTWHVSVDDTYQQESIHLDIWLNDRQIPIRGDILWQGRRILSTEIRDFRLL